LQYPAIAEYDETHRKKGEALFPELKPLDFLLQQRNGMTQASWEALYQQHPIVIGGGELPIEKLKVLPFLDRSKIMNSVRFWDKGGSDHEDAAYTAGCLMHTTIDRQYYHRTYGSRTLACVRARRANQGLREGGSEKVQKLRSTH